MFVPIFIGKPSLQFFNGLEETYEFNGAQNPMHFYSGLREMVYDFHAQLRVTLDHPLLKWVQVLETSLVGVTMFQDRRIGNME